MMIVGASAYALTAVGLARQTRWGRWLAIAILAVNALRDLLALIVRHDLRALIWLPIYGALIFYLVVRGR